MPVLSQCPMCCQAHEQKPVGRVGGQQADSCDVDFTTWRCAGCGGSWTGDPDVTAEVERLRADIKELRESMEYRSSLVGRLEQELYTLRAQLTERDAHPLRALGQEAYSTLVGMVEHCLNMRTCMGMDEGFKSFDSEEDHDFVKELRSFVALSASAEPSAPIEIDNDEIALDCATEILALSVKGQFHWGSVQFKAAMQCKVIEALERKQSCWRCNQPL
ncbi:hypothetical protein [Pseudomonas fulva]|uniref:hypothetical protein n=1 Tax=Pseudomonas fulva TaxID=47880 RepID=UPI0018A9383F|nr:hypothetical protein [Pseudomonas fulva]MBF8692552.1 hypothetical protein [Pseudomonas fulva]